jgi:hypothetical protein
MQNGSPARKWNAEDLHYTSVFGSVLEEAEKEGSNNNNADRPQNSNLTSQTNKQTKKSCSHEKV